MGTYIKASLNVTYHLNCTKYIFTQSLHLWNTCHYIFRLVVMVFVIVVPPSGFYFQLMYFWFLMMYFCYLLVYFWLLRMYFERRKGRSTRPSGIVNFGAKISKMLTLKIPSVERGRQNWQSTWWRGHHGEGSWNSKTQNVENDDIARYHGCNHTTMFLSAEVVVQTIDRYSDYYKVTFLWSWQIW